MNLRISARALRLRISIEEARLLLKERGISEHLAWPESRGFAYGAELVREGSLDLRWDDNRLRVLIPEDGVNALLRGTGKEDLVLSRVIGQENGAMELSVEIDLFSVRKRKAPRTDRLATLSDS